MISPALLTKYPIISDQITKAELQVVLRELGKVVQGGVSGDIVEFGCYSGTTSLFVRRLLNEYGSAAAFHVYDSFEGLPPKSQQDRNAAGVDFAAGELSVSKRQFTKNFERASLQLPVIHKGWFSQLTTRDLPDEIAFAFLDGDFYESILDSLELVWPRLADGAMVLVHDYNRETLPGVARAVDCFMRRRNLSLRIQAEANIGIMHPGK